MASIEECREALLKLSDRFAAGKAEGMNRTLSCHITDLDAVFNAKLVNGAFHELNLEPAPKAQIRLTVKSDDLIKLASGELNFVKAWASGSVKLEAGMMDMLRLRSLL